jgi:hypothetical protein
MLKVCVLGIQIIFNLGSGLIWSGGLVLESLDYQGHLALGIGLFVASSVSMNFSGSGSWC